jgi:hypothetical protein
MRRAVMGFVLLTAFALLATGALSVAAQPKVELTACLKTVPGEPLGEAVYTSWDEDTRRLEVSVALGPGYEGKYRIVIDCVRLDAKLEVDSTGVGELRLDTRWGDIIPPVGEGSTICIKLDQVMTLSGKFA